MSPSQGHMRCTLLLLTLGDGVGTLGRSRVLLLVWDTPCGSRPLPLESRRFPFHTWIPGTPTLFKAGARRKPAPSLTTGVPLGLSALGTQTEPSGGALGVQSGAPRAPHPSGMLPAGSCLTHPSKALLLHEVWGFSVVAESDPAGCKQVQLLGFLLRPDFGL